MFLVLIIIGCLTVISSLYFLIVSKSPISTTLILILILIFSYIHSKNKWSFLSKAYNIFGKYTLLYILLVSVLLRLSWVLLVPTKPVSDFAVMFHSAASAAQGNYSAFHGTSYFARFPHNTAVVLYFSLFYKITATPLMAIKLLNVLYQTLSVYFVYLLAGTVYKSKRIALSCAFLLSVFPPFIMYCSQITSENIAVPLFILSIYFYFKSFGHTRERTFLVLSGLILSLANIFRMVGTIFLIAYILYLFFYESFVSSVKKSIYILSPFFLSLYILSNLLVYNGVTEAQLWNPREPFTTSILKGTNLKSLGLWNIEDASLPDKLNYDTKAIKQESLKIIKYRLTSTPLYKLFPFYVAKLSAQWGLGDFGAYIWTVPDADSTKLTLLLKKNESIIMILCNAFLLFLEIKAFRVYLINKNVNNFNYFFTILFGGFVLIYLITEMQPRYGFIAAWLFVILGNGQHEHLNLGFKTY